MLMLFVYLVKNVMYYRHCTFAFYTLQLNIDIALSTSLIVVTNLHDIFSIDTQFCIVIDNIII